MPYETSTLRIAPGERYDVIVEISGNIGDTLALSNHGVRHDGSAEEMAPLLTVVIEDGDVTNDGGLLFRFGLELSTFS